MTDKEEREVRRYTPRVDGHMIQVPDGEWVHAADYDAANQRIKVLEALLAPRTYSPNIEPVICPACHGAMDDHRGNCPVEAYQLATVLDELKTLQQQTERLVEAAGRALDKMSLATPEDCELWNVLREALKPFQKSGADET